MNRQQYDEDELYEDWVRPTPPGCTLFVIAFIILAIFYIFKLITM